MGNGVIGKSRGTGSNSINLKDEGKRRQGEKEEKNNEKNSSLLVN